ncbi:kinase that interacts with cdc31p [Dipsacomyces acuminosporus]|nr:kinase that interacts with cdc31p [Dipsacomyces acuminosporus]
MTWAGNTSLFQYIREAGVQLSMRYIPEICLAVSRLHGAGIVHNDLKSPNIVVGERIMLVDFEFSFFAASGVSPHRTTLRWAAPEVVHNESSADFKSDVYSLGVTIWECMTGLAPFSHLDDKHVESKIKQSGFTECLAAAGQYCKLIAHLTEADPALRPSSEELPALVSSYDFPVEPQRM